MSVLAPGASGRWEPAPARAGLQTAPGLIVYRFGADLFYANADGFADAAQALVAAAPAPVRDLVIDASATTSIDFSAARVFRALIASLQQRGVRVVMGRVSNSLRADLERHGVAAALGESQIFPTLHEALEAVGVDYHQGMAPRLPDAMADSPAV